MDENKGEHNEGNEEDLYHRENKKVAKKKKFDSDDELSGVFKIL